MFTAETKTGDIVTKFPGASKLFKERRIDYCCGGNRPIGEVLQEKNLPLSLIDELNQMAAAKEIQPINNWDQMSEVEIVDIILSRFHVPTFELLDELTQFVNKVVSVHGGDQPHLVEMKSVFNEIRNEMRDHFQKEEVMLFPHIKQFSLTKSSEERVMIQAMIQQMEFEHDGVGALLSKLRDITHDYQAPESACNTYRLTYLKLEELESLTFDHIHTENNILFKRFA